MNLTAFPTLQKIALLKLAVTICSEIEFKQLIDQYVIELDERSKAKLNEKISYLKLPKSLQWRLKSFIKPVMIEIISWIFSIRHIHTEVWEFSRTCDSCLTEIDLQENLRWQSVGLIDKEQTSLCLIGDRRLDNAFRFVLACNCCSASDIRTLWQRLSSDVQRRFTQKKFTFLPVVNYWTRRMKVAKGLNYKFMSNRVYPSVFEFDYSDEYLESMYLYYETVPSILLYYLFGTYARVRNDLRMMTSDEELREEYRNRVTLGLVNVDNVTAMKHFLKKFDKMQGQKLLEVVARNRFISNELLFFCVSQMSDDQVRALLRRRGRRSRVVSCLVNSPWQESFWDFIDPIWKDLTTNDFSELLTYIVNFKLNEGSQDFNISQVLETCGVGSEIFEGDFRSNCRRVIKKLMKNIEL